MDTLPREMASDPIDRPKVRESEMVRWPNHTLHGRRHVARICFTFFIIKIRTFFLLRIKVYYP